MTTSNDNEIPTTFTVGQFYAETSICDSESVTVIKIIKRTAKSVTFLEHGEAPKTRKIHLYRGEETFYPYGQYSMATIIRADTIGGRRLSGPALVSYINRVERLSRP